MGTDEAAPKDLALFPREPPTKPDCCSFCPWLSVNTAEFFRECNFPVGRMLLLPLVATNCYPARFFTV